MNEVAAKSLLGALIGKGGADLEAVGQQIHESDLGNDQLVKVYRAVQKLNGSTTSSTVRDYLIEKVRIDPEDASELVSGCIGSWDGAESPVALARYVHRARIERDVMELGGAIAQGYEPHTMAVLIEKSEELARLDAPTRAEFPEILTGEQVRADAIPAEIAKGLVFEGSLHTLTGGSKAGKSWFSVQLAMAVATGSPFLGLPTVKTRTLYFSLEMVGALVLKRMDGIVSDTDTPMPCLDDEFLMIAPTQRNAIQFPLTDQRARDYLQQVIEDRGVGFCVLDTAYRFMPGEDMNDTARMGLIYSQASDLARTSGAGIWVLDHVSKGSDSGDGPASHSALGSVLKGAAANVIANIRAIQGSHGRYSSWALNVDSHYGSWDEELTMTRPEDENGVRGSGFVAVSSSEARGIDEAQLEALFSRAPDTHEGLPCFPSKNALIMALAGVSKSTGTDLVNAIERDYCARATAYGAWKEEKPIWIYDGPRNAKMYVWRRHIEGA